MLDELKDAKLKVAKIMMRLPRIDVSDALQVEDELQGNIPCELEEILKSLNSVERDLNSYINN